eukprot:Gb_11524 [translate_table: standard]
MARSQIGSIVKVSVYRFYSSAHHALFPRNHLSKGLPYIQVYSLSSFPGLFGHGPTDILRRARKDVGGSLRLPVLYWNNYVCSYTTSSKSKRSGPDKNPRLLEIGTTSSERTFRLSIVPLALLAFVGVGLLLHYNDERRSIPKASQQGSIRNMQNAISKPSIGGPFELINYEGKVVTDREFVGYWTLIYFGYTSSPDVGPEEVRKMARAIDILDAKANLRINAIFITLDPLRDTPSQLHAYLQEFHPRIVGLTGPVNALRQIAQEYRVYFKKKDAEGSDYLIDCSHNMYLMDPNMEFVRMFGVEYNADQLADGIVSEVKKVSKSFQ